ncbi:CPXCG motif-containing cysteine-rich protein [Colwellia sp. C1TZA3]|uniref:CPXCG motif-containing cysteine-rich protein n=1 Tax=Colwellia sp. C1TZA3 TaxID=2508879 RepID=UPI0011BA2F55|nr:CPXCG motif-containing cysteine-rich protein [Colwellia sp. C1TZA3]TWX73336.1 CPXCG motif-containing cysteine-rich protein [Colwellia sp. C1TZA3]
MPHDIKEQRIECPHCGHSIRLDLDTSAGDQDYYEECPACCMEMHLNLHIDEYRQKILLGVGSDNEQFF